MLKALEALETLKVRCPRANIPRQSAYTREIYSRYRTLSTCYSDRTPAKAYLHDCNVDGYVDGYIDVNVHGSVNCNADGYLFTIMEKYSAPKGGVLTKIRSFLKKIAAVGDSQIHRKNVSVRQNYSADRARESLKRTDF